ncbi:MAG: DUF4271 domain-containing protein [Bacteroidales bacterium]|nr:DUF4271 domain-containing protein [Bacteroidales bacterium]
MTITRSETQQDTIPGRNVILQDSIRIKSDSVSLRLQSDSASIKLQSDSASVILQTDSASVILTSEIRDSVILTKALQPKKVKFVITDTTSVCCRNNIADITFYNSNNFIPKIGDGPFNRFPFLFTEKNRQTKIDAKTSLIQHLRTGEDLLPQPLHNDWIIGIILIAAFLYSLIRTASKGILQGASRLFQLKGIIDPFSRNNDDIFQWQSTIHNLISFLIIGLFAYCASYYYNFTPFGISGILLWLIFFSIIIVSVTLRHFICVIAGNISGEKDVFKEYLVGIYQSYRFSALFLFVLVILMLYTVILPPSICFIIGSIVLSIIYLIRVTRLLIIFINHNISIFYLILYLCALEILPVLISVKYFTGLI